MLAAIITPIQHDGVTLDAIVREALSRGLVACNAKRGPFRVAFFHPDHVPAGWSRIGAAHKAAAPCAA